MKILLAVDGSPYTKQMLAYLAAHDDLLGNKHEYTVLHCSTPLPNQAAAFVPEGDVRGYHEEMSAAVFKPIRAFCKQQGIEPAFVGVVGYAGESIAERATAGKFDLIVMGSHGHGGFVNLVLGSVANKVLAHCKVPVLLVR